MQFHHHVFDNGLTVIGETNPAARSVAIGFMVRTGARNETPDVNGVSHFLEHMMFKGTPRRTAMDVNREFDEIGAKYNAFTTEENTAYWGAVLPEYLPQLTELLTDILRPSLRNDDFDMEKKVILEEIGMYEDQPMWCAYEAIMRDHFGKHPLGNSVLGSIDSVSALTSDQMRSYFEDRYVPGNILVTVTGNTDWDPVLEALDKQTKNWSAKPPAHDVQPATGSRKFRMIHNPKLNQQHVLLMSNAPINNDKDRFAADVLATVVGDNSGSRLFWDLVDPGFAESADMDYHEYYGAGAFMSYICCAPEHAQRNLDRVREILGSLGAEGITEAELEQVKNKVSARIVLKSERPMGRLMPVGFNWLYRQQYRSIDDDLTSLQAVTCEDVQRVAQAHPLDEITLVSLGPLENTELK